MRIAMVTPIVPGQRGNGSAQRAAFWHRTLEAMGDLTTIVIPLLGTPPADDDRLDLGEVINVAPMELAHPDHPWFARHAPRYLGAHLSTEVDAFDLVVGYKSHVGPFCLGLVAAGHTPLVIDLDDDDAAFAESLGEFEAARRYRAMIAECRPRASLLTSAQGFPGTVAVPNAFPIETAAPTTDRENGSTVLMVGNLTYRPNHDGAQWLVEQVWPLVAERHPAARLVIAGHGSDRLAHGVGFVDDLTALYRSAALTVAPILHGSGTRIKILESWVQRVPVVATPLGIEGLGAVHGEHALIAVDPHGIAEQIGRLLTDPDLRRSVAENADRHVRARFDPELLGSQVRQLLQRVCTPPVGPQRFDGPVATEVGDGLVVDDEANGAVHHLDPIASIVYSLCDGDATTEVMADTLGELLGSSDITMVRRRLFIAIDQLVDAGLVLDDPTYERIRRPGSTRRFRVRPRTYDANVAHHVYWGNEYDLPGEISAGTVVIDIGAHIGSFSALMADSGAALVIALEPQPDNNRLAQINLAHDIEAGTVELRADAIWSPPADQTIVIGTAPLSTTGNDTVNTGGHVARAADGTGPVGEHETTARSTTVDRLLDEVRSRHGDDVPIWMKLDCEGAEWAVLDTSERLGDVDVLVAELHLAAVELPEEATSRLRRRLESFGLHVDLTPDPGGPHLSLRAERITSSDAPVPPRPPQPL